MLKAIKNYTAFTSWKYRFGVFIVVPVLLILLASVGLMTDGEVPVLVLKMIIFMMFIMAEILSDHWFMSGFYGKHNSSLEYLQTSNRFSKIVKDVVIVDIVRRLITAVVLYDVVLMFGLSLGEPMEVYQAFAFLPLYSFVIVVITNFITRHFNTWQYVYSGSALAMLVASWGLTHMMEFTMKYMGVSLGILTVLAVLVTGVTIWYSLKKVKDSYYDK